MNAILETLKCDIAAILQQTDQGNKADISQFLRNELHNALMDAEIAIKSGEYKYYIKKENKK